MNNGVHTHLSIQAKGGDVILTNSITAVTFILNIIYDRISMTERFLHFKDSLLN